MRARPQQARAIRKREALLNCARDEFEEKGFEGATARSIAERAGVATGTFYQYFSNKDEILRELTDQRFAEHFANIEVPDIRNAGRVSLDNLHPLFVAVLEYLYQFHADERGFHSVLDQRRGSDELLDKQISEHERVLLARTEQVIRRTGCEHAERVAYCVFAMAEGLVHRHVHHPLTSMDFSELADTGARILVDFVDGKRANGRGIQ